MHTVHQSPAVSVTAAPTRDLDADLLVVPAYEDDDLADQPGLDAATGGAIADARARGEFKGKPYELLITSLAPGGWRARRLVLIGAGPRAEADAALVRRIASMAGLTARQRRLGRLAIVLRSVPGVAADRAVQAAVEGVTLANFDGGSYKTEQPRAWLETVLLQAGGDHLEAALERGRVLGECTNLSRAMSNEPGNHLTPRLFAERGAAIASAAGLDVEVLDEARIAELRMGMLLGVARGSQEPPRLLVVRYTPPSPRPGVVLGLVGKGITFDTGGISIKPADNMDKMKDDMSGGAAVICAIAAMARLKAPVACIGVVPMSENMPGGRAIKPGDILTSAEGKTVEVLNTDAEGRLILGDGLWYARQLGATHLVDIATLTGACVVALGKSTSGVFGTPSGWVNDVMTAADRAGDRCWPMPVYDDYKEQLKSEIADFTNTGGRPGGAITAALFLKEFAGGLPWVHIDIAGTAWAEESKPYQPKGATGVGVRTLAELALNAAAWGNLK
ncbi:MAG: leucyl aminopeptidase [Vicinamibacterales bacterium]